ncbi:hypothetical protein [Methylobacter sp. S3L5C]|uniref:hypothetical protein n=1 Tax=Methylobacter sp. S3L5C TaxID=2839024 RepID=UPI001FAB4460|nr:hypothetical protein [Methylobacter sp. S3L5C]UOA08117.1 hypothetical protein KKZ03_18135 [Methylobacter sp. S3L5C]
MKRIYVIIALVAAVLMSTAAAADKVTKKDFVSIENQIYILKHYLKDVDSAKFRDVFISRIESGYPVVCGEVNSKNSYGAYSGFTRFISSSTENQEGVWEMFCGNKIGSYKVK